MFCRESKDEKKRYNNKQCSSCFSVTTSFIKTDLNKFSLNVYCFADRRTNYLSSINEFRYTNCYVLFAITSLMHEYVILKIFSQKTQHRRLYLLKGQKGAMMRCVRVLTKGVFKCCYVFLAKFDNIVWICDIKDIIS